MYINLKRFAMGTLLLASFFLILAGCGGGDYSSGRAGAGASSQTISGVAAKGRIAGATITVWQLANGQKGAKLGETKSLSDGSYSLSIPGASGPVLVEATGNSTATYLDEKDPYGQPKPFGAGQILRAAVPDAANIQTIALTPLTEMAVLIATGPGGLILTADILKANKDLSSLFGLDITATLPNQIDAAHKLTDINDPRDKYGVFLAGIQLQSTTGNTYKEIVESIAAEIKTAVATGGPLGPVGANLLTAVTVLVLQDEFINPNPANNRLPESITAAFSADVLFSEIKDTTSPSAPSNLAAMTFATSDATSSVVLTWNPSTDNVGVAGYDIYRAGLKIATVSQPGCTITAVPSGVEALYYVIGFDAAGNRSAASNQLSVRPNQASLGVTVSGQVTGISGLPSLDITAPSAPANLLATAFATSGTTSTVVLTWNPSTDNVGVLGYEIYRANTRIATVSQPGYTDVGLTSGATYNYFVIAFDAAGNRSAASNQLSVRPEQASLGVTVSGQVTGISGLPIQDTTAPTAPSNLTATTFATSAAASAVVLIWNPSTDNVGVAGYEIYRVGAKIAQVAQPGYTDVGVSSGATHNYFIIAFDAAGNRSAMSNQLSVTPNQASLGVTVSGQLTGISGLPILDTAAPSVPNNLMATTYATSANLSMVVLTWNSATDNMGVAGYEIYRGGLRIATASQPGYTDAGVLSGTTYNYAVVAYDAAGNRSAASSPLSVTPNRASLGVTVGGQITGISGLPIPDTAAPTVPFNLAATTLATSGTASTVILTWNASTDNVGVAGYEIWRAGVKIGTVSQPGYTDLGVPSGATYNYSVVAYDAAGNRSSASSPLSVTPNQASLGVTVSGQLTGISGLPILDASAPTAPSNLVATSFATSAATSSVVLTWNPSTDNVGVAGYEIWRAGLKIATVSQPGYTVALVPSGVEANYYVIAFDVAGNRSTRSNELPVRPNQASLGVTVSGQIAGVSGLPLLDITAPTAPVNLAAATFATSGTVSTVVLTWSPSTDNVGVAGYEIYRDGVNIAQVSQPGYTHVGVTSGTMYNYFVIAFDAAGNRSAAGAPLPVRPNQASLGVTVSGQVIPP